MNWHNLYKGPPAMSNAVEAISKAADNASIPPMEAAYRWVVHNSPLRAGDGVIIGARNVEQLKESVGGIKKGPLPEDLAKAMEGVWSTIEDVAPGDV